MLVQGLVGTCVPSFLHIHGSDKESIDRKNALNSISQAVWNTYLSKNKDIWAGKDSVIANIYEAIAKCHHNIN